MTFEEWWINGKTIVVYKPIYPAAKIIWDTAYSAGLERAAEIAESTYPELIDGQIEQVFCFEFCEDIATAIREEIK